MIKKPYSILTESTLNTYKYIINDVLDKSIDIVGYKDKRGIPGKVSNKDIASEIYSYFLAHYYKAIDLIGATQAMGLNISYPAWAFVFQYLIDRQFSLYLFILAIFIMIGSIMSNEKPKEVLNLFRPKNFKNKSKIG